MSQISSRWVIRSWRALLIGDALSLTLPLAALGGSALLFAGPASARLWGGLLFLVFTVIVWLTVRVRLEIDASGLRVVNYFTRRSFGWSSIAAVELGRAAFGLASFPILVIVGTDGHRNDVRASAWLRRATREKLFDALRQALPDRIAREVAPGWLDGIPNTPPFRKR